MIVAHRLLMSREAQCGGESESLMLLLLFIQAYCEYLQIELKRSCALMKLSRISL